MLSHTIMPLADETCGMGTKIYITKDLHHLFSVAIQVQLLFFMPVNQSGWMGTSQRTECKLQSENYPYFHSIFCPTLDIPKAIKDRRYHFAVSYHPKVPETKRQLLVWWPIAIAPLQIDSHTCWRDDGQPYLTVYNIFCDHIGFILEKCFDLLTWSVLRECYIELSMGRDVCLEVKTNMVDQLALCLFMVIKNARWIGNCWHFISKVFCLAEGVIEVHGMKAFFTIFPFRQHVPKRFLFVLLSNEVWTDHILKFQRSL